jgi:hypothetical protein
MHGSKGFKRRRTRWSKGSSRPERDVRHRFYQEIGRGRGRGSPTSTETVIFFVLDGFLGFHGRLPVAHDLAAAGLGAYGMGAVCFTSA